MRLRRYFFRLLIIRLLPFGQTPVGRGCEKRFRLWQLLLLLVSSPITDDGFLYVRNQDYFTYRKDLDMLSAEEYFNVSFS